MIGMENQDLNGWFQHQNDYPRCDLHPSRHVRKFCPFGGLRILCFKPTQGAHQGLQACLQYSLSSALLVMSDFESKFLKEYSWLQRIYHILIVKAVMTLWGLNTKKATYTHYRSQTAALFLMKTETRHLSKTFHPVGSSSLNSSHFISTNNLKGVKSGQKHHVEY